jgi:hypothetical protein
MEFQTPFAYDPADPFLSNGNNLVKSLNRSSYTGIKS